MDLSNVAELLLSICLPIFNQAPSFHEQVLSLVDVPSHVKQHTEFVIVDDGSTDDLPAALDQLQGAGWRLKTFRNQQNLGRAASLAKSLRAAQGQYVLIMDGDDPFVEDGLAGIYEALRDLEASAGNRACLGLVFGTLIDDGISVRRNAPPDRLECTLLALRADHGISGDLKEVIRRELLLSALCPLFEAYRRVPTSLLWTRISGLGPVRCSSKIVVQKSYDEGGITRNLEMHRSANLPPLLALYMSIADARSYKSRLYRLRAAINYHRFLVRGCREPWRFRSDFFGIAALVGVAVGLIERKRLSARRDTGQTLRDN